MPVIAASTESTIRLADAEFTPLAAPSRGATRNAVWRVRVTGGEPGAEHTLDAEEVLVALSGAAVATLDGVAHPVRGGDTIVVPPGVPFSLRCDGDPFEALAVLPVGGRACMTGGEPFVPPWAQ